jgi:hypothetical protein
MEHRLERAAPAVTPLYRSVYIDGDERLTQFIDDLTDYDRSNLVEAIFDQGTVFLRWDNRPIPRWAETHGCVNVPARDPHDSWTVVSDIIHDQTFAPELTELPYDEYLKTAHWRRCREWALTYYGASCVLCGRRERLEVHHRTYTRLGQELITDLIVLCGACHARHHGKLAR